MYILTAVIFALIALLYKLGAAFGAWNKATTQSQIEKKRMEWAREHEDEWLPNTDRVIKENGQLYYFSKTKDRFHVPVEYGCDATGSHWGLVFAGEVMFGYNSIIKAQCTTDHRMQYDNEGNRIISIGRWSTNLGKGYDPLTEVFYNCGTKQYCSPNYKGKYVPVEKEYFGNSLTFCILKKKG